MHETFHESCDISNGDIKFGVYHNHDDGKDYLLHIGTCHDNGLNKFFTGTYVSITELRTIKQTIERVIAKWERSHVEHLV